MRLNPAVALTLFSFLALPAAASGCDHESESGGENTCGEQCTYIERGGRATLYARTTFDDYQAATMSFEYATEVDEGQIRNDWDLLFGNDQDPEADYFTVPAVSDVQGAYVSAKDIPSLIRKLGEEMRKAAGRLEFEKAAEIRDKIQHLEEMELKYR